MRPDPTGAQTLACTSLISPTVRNTLKQQPTPGHTLKVYLRVDVDSSDEGSGLVLIPPTGVL